VTLNFEIQTSGPLLAFELLGRPKSIEIGKPVPVPGLGTLCLEEMREQRSVDLPTVLKFGITFATGAVSSLAANWLYEKLKGRARSLRIDRVEIQIDEGEIKKILATRLESK
jgi:hypothetical protein